LFSEQGDTNKCLFEEAGTFSEAAGSVLEFAEVNGARDGEGVRHG
jgi:hypothetical protein